LSLRAFTREERAGFPAPVYFIHSKDRYLLTEAGRKITGTLTSEKDSLSLAIFDGDVPESEQPDMDSIITALRTPGFFGEKKTVLIRNTHKFRTKKLKKLLNYIQNPFPDTSLIMLSERPPAGDLKAALDSGKLLSLELKGRELLDWIINRGKEEGIIIGRDVADFLAGITAGNTGQIAREIEKLSLMGKDKITLNDLNGLVAGGIQTSIFTLTTALANRDQDGVFRLFNAMKDSIEAIPAIGAINYKFASLTEKGGKPSYYRKVFRTILEADKLAKSTGGEYPLEDLLIRLLQI
jgi:DNA polymerase III delta subunit